MLSIITITHRDPAGLRATCESLLPLTTSGLRWEHVIVDASTQENAAILDDLAQKKWPLVHLPEPAQGIYAAQNSGCEKAQGDLLWILNGGDRLAGIGALQEILRAFETDPELSLAIATAARVRSGVKQYLVSPPPSLRAGVLGGNTICHQAVLYRRVAWEKLGPYSTKYRLAADYDHHLRAYLAGATCRILPDAHLVDFDSDGESATGWRKALDEFEAVGRSHAAEMTPTDRLAHELKLAWRRRKIGLVKALAASRFSAALRPAWLWWNRR